MNLGASVINALTGERSADLESLKFDETQSQNAITNQYNRDALAVDKAYKEGQITDKERTDEITKLKNERDAYYREITKNETTRHNKALEDAAIERNKIAKTKAEEDKTKPIQSGINQSIFEMTTDKDGKYVAPSITQMKAKKSDIETATKGKSTLIVVDLEPYDPVGWGGSNITKNGMQIPFSVVKDQDFKESTLVDELVKTYKVDLKDAKAMASKWFKNNKLVNLE